ncbi:hypothetical protein F4778DRAFT_757028 [Xylariomycetidae sp. FL2044]|nr:hypothetical protein F4778DRAFT_757028 [Xylariomycetidae sp. FL2044]
MSIKSMRRRGLCLFPPFLVKMQVTTSPMLPCRGRGRWSRPRKPEYVDNGESFRESIPGWAKGGQEAVAWI